MHRLLVMLLATWPVFKRWPLSSFRTQDAPGPELILPASIEFRESSEDSFLSAIINYTNSSTVHFKLSPTYVLYMACRYVLSCQYRPEVSPAERTHKVIAIVNRMVSMMEGVIQVSLRLQSQLSKCAPCPTPGSQWLSCSRLVTCWIWPPQSFLKCKFHK